MPRRSYPEEQLQKSVAEFLDLALPDDAVWWHTPNQRGTRKRWENELLKAMGVKGGIPDILILWCGVLYCIELKAPKGSLSEAQKDMRERLVMAGAHWSMARAPEHVETALRAWCIPLRASLRAAA